MFVAARFGCNKTIGIEKDASAIRLGQESLSPQLARLCRLIEGDF